MFLINPNKVELFDGSFFWMVLQFEPAHTTVSYFKRLRGATLISISLYTIVKQSIKKY